MSCSCWWVHTACIDLNIYFLFMFAFIWKFSNAFAERCHDLWNRLSYWRLELRHGMNTHAKNAHNTTVLSGSTFSVLLGTGNSSCSVLLSYSFCFFLKWTCFLFLSTILCCGFVLSLYHWNAFSLWQYFFGSLHWDCSGIFVVTICSGNYFEKIEGDMKPVTKRSRCFILEVLWLCLKLSLAGT